MSIAGEEEREFWEEVDIRGVGGKAMWGKGRAINIPKQQHFLFNHRVLYKTVWEHLKYTRSTWQKLACIRAC